MDISETESQDTIKGITDMLKLLITCWEKRIPSLRTSAFR